MHIHQRKRAPKISNIFPNVTRPCESDSNWRKYHSEIRSRVTDLARAFIYFGLITGNKVLEFYIKSIGLLRRKAIFIDAAIIGSMVDNNSVLAKHVRAAAYRYNIQLVLNSSPDAVSEELQKSTIALLPFPDGITEKRGFCSSLP